MSTEDPRKGKFLGNEVHLENVYGDYKFGGPAPFISVSSLKERDSSWALHALSTDDEPRLRRALISLIIGEQQLEGTLGCACVWYIQWLEQRFEEQWHLLRSALVKLNEISEKPHQGDLAQVYATVIHILRVFMSKEDSALVEIVDNLDNEGLLRTHLDEDEERAAPNQAVFSILGWLTMLYAPAIRPAENKLEIRQACIHPSQDQAISELSRYHTIQEDFDYIDRPFFDILARFGVLPLCRTTQRDGRLETFLESKNDTIMPEYISYQTLQDTGIEILWVESLSDHLELDGELGILKLFRYPSFCRIMYSSREDNILSQLCKNHGGNTERTAISGISAKDYSREIISSYRLIFGRQQNSSQAGFKLVESLHASQSVQDFDPLLSVVCGNSLRSVEARQLYQEMDIAESDECCDAYWDYPILGHKLLQLQNHVQKYQTQNPFSLRDASSRAAAWSSLWNNKTLLASLAVGIALLITSLFFQIWQIILTRQQVELAQHSGFS